MWSLTAVHGSQITSSTNAEKAAPQCYSQWSRRQVCNAGKTQIFSGWAPEKRITGENKQKSFGPAQQSKPSFHHHSLSHPCFLKDVIGAGKFSVEPWFELQKIMATNFPWVISNPAKSTRCWNILSYNIWRYRLTCASIPDAFVFGSEKNQA